MIMNIENNINEFIAQWYTNLHSNIILSSETEDEVWFELQSILSRIISNDLCVRIEDKLSE